MNESGKSLLKLSAGIYAYVSAIFTATAILPATLNNHHEDDYRIAEDLGEYFNYLSSQTVNGESEVHEVVPIQLVLEAKGYDLGVCGSDGMAGPAFRAAVSQYQEDNGLEVSGEATPDTISYMVDDIFSDPEAYATLNAQLIIPYQDERTQKFMASLDDKFSGWSHFSALLRPDMMLYAGIEGGLVNGGRANMADEVFPGCANAHQRDAYRHSATAVRIADFPTGSVSSAETFLNIREISGNNPLPTMLMDIYNHSIAVGFAERLAEQDSDIDDPEDILIEAVRQGEFVTYPLPLVPVDFEGKRELPQPVPVPRPHS